VTITDGGSVDYECRLVVGCKPDQSLEWSWYKEETMLSKSQRFSFSELTNDTCKSILSIKSASMLDAGSYTCVATNSLGSANTTFTLRVKGKYVENKINAESISDCWEKAALNRIRKFSLSFKS
jgi:hypothetical protein